MQASRRRAAPRRAVRGLPGELSRHTRYQHRECGAAYHVDGFAHRRRGASVGGQRLCDLPVRTDAFRWSDGGQIWA